MNDSIYPITAGANSGLIIAAGVGQCEYQYHCIRKEGYPQPQINFCTDGSGVLITEGKTTQITSGMSFFLPPDTAHEYYATGKDKLWSLKWVTFSGTGCNALLEQFGMTHALVTTHEDYTDMDRSWKSIFTTLQKGGENASLIANAYIYRYLTEYHISRIKSLSTPSELTAYRLAEEYISKHFTENITITDIADAAGISPQYLCRIFRRKADMRPFEYITCRRIQLAKQLLAAGSMTVTEIAERVGYNDASYFCKIFRRQENVSPNKFMTT